MINCILPSLLAIGLPVGGDWLILGLIGLFLFGKRLPEVGRGLGKGILEFKRGLKAVEEDVNEAGNTSTPAARPQLTSQPAAPALPAQTQSKFDPNTGQPLETATPAGAKFDPYTGKPIAAQASSETPPADHNHATRPARAIK